VIPRCCMSFLVSESIWKGSFIFVRIILVLEYDGSRYCGWQSQPKGCSIQDALEVALSQIAREDIRVITAGRTDAGVHALYQVVHFDTCVKRPISAWIRGVNALLPDDIAVLWATEASEQFHARYSAVERRYLYLLLNQPVRPGYPLQESRLVSSALGP
jgi:tRNA pseudouridine38-40 synthase